jgi:hypothetical protein
MRLNLCNATRQVIIDSGSIADAVKEAYPDGVDKVLPSRILTRQASIL